MVRRAKHLNQDEALIKRITSTKDDKREGSYSTIKRIAEGITHAKDPDTIILWETYERESDGKYRIHTASPQFPSRGCPRALHASLQERRIQQAGTSLRGPKHGQGGHVAIIPRAESAKSSPSSRVP